MKFSCCEVCDRNPDTDDPDFKNALYWMSLANMLGYNELAKLADNLGAKAYFRLLREESKKRYSEAGGKDPDLIFTKESETDEVLTIAVPYSNLPHIVFRPRDVELMRDYVYQHDKKRRDENL